MGHPRQADSAEETPASTGANTPAPTTVRDVDPIIQALVRVRGAVEMRTVLSWRETGESVLEYVQSLPHHDDIIGLEVLLADARAARDALERDFYSIPKKVKSSTAEALIDNGEAYSRKVSEIFELFMQSQETVSAIRDDLNLLKDIVDARPKPRRPRK